MTVRDERREAAIDRMADHVIAEGLGGASLRPLAAAAGTSDRMLLYYFRDKDELLGATLARVAGRLTDQLDQALPAGKRLAFPALLEAIWSALGSASVKPYMHLWLDIAALAARGVEPHRTIAGQIADGFLAWIEIRLRAEGEEGRRDAAQLLAVVEGALLLDAMGRSETAEVAIARLGTARSA